MARDGAQRLVLGAVGAGDLQRGGEDAEGRGRERQRDVAGRSRRQVAVRAAEMEDALPADQGRRDVHALAGGPQLERGGLLSCRAAPIRRCRRGTRRPGRNGTSWAQVKYGASVVSPPTNSWVVEGPSPTPMRAGAAYWPRMMSRWAQQPPPPDAGQSDVGASRPVVVHPHGQRTCPPRTRRSRWRHPRCRRAGSSGRCARWRRPGRRRPNWRRAPRWVRCHGPPAPGRSGRTAVRAVSARSSCWAGSSGSPLRPGGRRRSWSARSGNRGWATPGCRRGRSSRAPGRCWPPDSGAGRSPHRPCRGR